MPAGAAHGDAGAVDRVSVRHGREGLSMKGSNCLWFAFFSARGVISSKASTIDRAHPVISVMSG